MVKREWKIYTKMGG